MIETALESVHELIKYDPENGKVWHRERDIKWFKSDKDWKAWNTRYSGKEITFIDTKGYIRARIPGKQFLIHRLIWFYMTGEWPEFIDHINGDRSDNRWCNLRNVTKQENAKNQKRHNTNTSGEIGVCWAKRDRKWHSQINDNDGIRVNLGYFDNFEEAVAARKAAEIKYGYHKNHGRN